MSEWEGFAEQLQLQDISFLVKPTIRFQGQPGEQATFFLQDPSGNVLEFKAFARDTMIFANSPQNLGPQKRPPQGPEMS